MDIPENRIRAEHLDIGFNQALLFSNVPQRIKLYYMAIFDQKIQLCLILYLLLGFLITNLTSIALFFHPLAKSN